jgi:hypothetical protein
MAQSLELNIKTTSDVPQAMDKAKSATVSFGRQVEDIQKKFSMAFKDVFLSFLGPMALVGAAMNQIGNLIEENRRKREEADKAAIDGTNELISAEERYWARKMAGEKKTKETKEQAKVSREQVTLSFLQEDPRGKEMLNQILAKMPLYMSTRAQAPLSAIAADKRVQDMVQKMLAEDLAKNPELNLEAVAAKKKAEEEAAKAKAKQVESKPAAFKGIDSATSVSGNVIGVGQNPVVSAIHEQVEIAKQQLDYLRMIASQKTPSLPLSEMTEKGGTPETPATK